MDQNHFTTDTLRKKGAHLTFEERVIIQTRLRDKQSYRSIAREIGCCVNTVRNEVKRGKVLCYNGKVERYRAADGQSTYETHRENCGRKCDAIAKEHSSTMCRRDFRNITGRSMPALAGHWLRENFNVARWSVRKPCTTMSRWGS